MQKIGIITELSLNTVNFGNHLQAYGLNHYLSEKYPEAQVETILLDKREKRKYASVFWWMRVMLRRCLAKGKRTLFPKNRGRRMDLRFQKFTQFARQYIYINDKLETWYQLKTSDYSAFVVGSDVVWYQWKGYIKRTKFLDFAHKKDTREGRGAIKIAYAASFGKNEIPPENARTIKRCLDDFYAISIREKASAELLADIDVQGAVHVCDPVLLLSKEEWEKIERKPALQEMPEYFCFAYLLGQSEKQREKIEWLCRKEGLCLVTVPYINGYEEDGTDCFGDIQVCDCSPQEWLWLIHHAQYVVTDSFHGLVFSTLFSKKFLAVRRASQVNWNVRLEDYLDTLEEKDKYVEVESLSSFAALNWDDEKVQRKLAAWIGKSKEFLDKALRTA